MEEVQEVVVEKYNLLSKEMSQYLKKWEVLKPLDDFSVYYFHNLENGLKLNFKKT